MCHVQKVNCDQIINVLEVNLAHGEIAQPHVGNSNWANASGQE